MPWKVETVMSQRKEFVTLAQSEGVNMSELCLRTGISRKTGYKWLKRYLEGGDDSLHDLPKRPVTPRTAPANRSSSSSWSCAESTPPREVTCWPGCSKTEDATAYRPRAPSQPS